MIRITCFADFRNAVLKEYRKQTGEPVPAEMKRQLNILYKEGYEVMEAVEAVYDMVSIAEAY